MMAISVIPGQLHKYSATNSKRLVTGHMNEELDFVSMAFLVFALQLDKSLNMSLGPCVEIKLHHIAAIE
ncbi:Uncharacterized protein HZ326_28499 [Fusarium oxysporum f. sp. albedinis]|nr:Uncharacterized protein HZ326_28499 [Fusarium oxysporum f. sp. albedinis]